MASTAPASLPAASPSGDAPSVPSDSRVFSATAALTMAPEPASSPTAPPRAVRIEFLFRHFCVEGSSIMNFAGAFWRGERGGVRPAATRSGRGRKDPAIHSPPPAPPPLAARLRPPAPAGHPVRRIRMPIIRLSMLAPE
jgi:hypothetical protein